MLTVFVGVLLFVATVSTLADRMDRRDEKPAAASEASTTTRATRVQPAPTPPPLIQKDSTDQLFLQVLRENGVDFGNDDDAIIKAQGVCVFLREGTDPAEILASIQRVAPPMSPSDAGFLFGAAAEAYCPELNPAG